MKDKYCDGILICEACNLEAAAEVYIDEFSGKQAEVCKSCLGLLKEEEMESLEEVEYCDNCGDEIKLENRFIITTLPCNIDSANEGESATLCKQCYFVIIRREG